MMASSETEPPPPQPSPKARRRSAAFIAVFLAFQFLVPLTYLVREDNSDERFTWRTLSEPAPPRCETRASLSRFDGVVEPLPLSALLHEDWLRYVQQGRRAVVDAFMLKQCEAEGVERVELVNECKDEPSRRSYSLRCGGERAHETTRTAAR
jgi:hypothetical protein